MSPDAVKAAHALQYGWWLARGVVFCHRDALGVSSGAYAGTGYAVRRSRGAANHGGVAWRG